MSVQLQKKQENFANESHSNICGTQNIFAREEDDCTDTFAKQMEQEFEQEQGIQDDNIEMTPQLSRKSYGQSNEGKSKPSVTECCQALMLIKKKLPHRSLDYTIRMLNRVVQQKHRSQFEQDQTFQIKTKKQIRTFVKHQEDSAKYIDQAKQIVENSIKPTVSLSLGISEMLNPNERIITFRKEDTLLTNFTNYEDELRYIAKTVCARAFVYRGYGIAQYRSAIRESGHDILVNRNKFKNVAGGMVTQAFRKLEEFVLNQCRKTIKLLNREQMRSLLTVMLNIRRKYEPQICNIFFKFIKIGFSLETVQTSQQQAIRLYVTFLKHIYGDNITINSLERLGEINKQRQIEHTVNYLVKKEERTELMRQLYRQRRSQANKCLKYKQISTKKKHIFGKEEFWTPQIDLALVKLYISEQNFFRIKQNLKFTYPEIRNDLTQSALMARFSRIMKRAIQKAQIQLRSEESSYFLNKFNKSQLRALIKSNPFKYIRVLLLKNYLQTSNITQLKPLFSEIKIKLHQLIDGGKNNDFLSDQELKILCSNLNDQTPIKYQQQNCETDDHILQDELHFSDEQSEEPSEYKK